MRNKKYNPFKVGERIMRKGLSNLGVFYSQKGINGDKRCIMVDYRDAHMFKVSSSAASAITNVEHPWLIYCLATGFERNGKLRMEVVEVKVRKKIYHSDQEFLNLVNEAHETLKSGFEVSNRLTNISWLASPNGEEISRAQIDSILTKYGAW